MNQQPLETTTVTTTAALGTILSVWAHPDDETYLAAGVMASARDAGNRVVCVTATSGERGTDDPVTWPPARLGQVRRWEADAAMAVLGVDEHQVLGLPDGELDPADQTAIDRIGSLLDEVRPDTILTFGSDGITYHPDHIAVHHWVTTAWLQRGRPCRLLEATPTIEFLDRHRDELERWHMYMTDERPTGVAAADAAIHLRLTGSELDRKLTALRALATQTGPLIAALDPEVYAEHVAEECFVDATTARLARSPATIAPPTNTALIDALETNFWSMWQQFGRGHNCRLLESPNVTRFETPIARLPYNAVIRFVAEDDIEREIDNALAPYARRQVPVMWVLHPTSTDDLTHRLAQRGLTAIEHIPGMARDLGDLPSDRPLPDGVVITEVESGDPGPYIDLVADRYGLGSDEAATIDSIWNAARFGAPHSPNRSWIASKHGTPLAKVTAHHVADIAGIYGVATTPNARRMGLARQLTLHAMKATRNNGARTAVLHSSAMAASLYRALGFEQIAEFRLLSRPGALNL